MSDVAAVALFFGVVLYGVFGGADFGAGFWDLTAGRRNDVRDLVEHSLGPVWEVNHVWLIFILVVLWTAFPHGFAAIMTTLYIPLGLAALGIVLRGSGFAFRKSLTDARPRQVTGLVFASSAIVTPFFLGTVAGAIASGRVPGKADGWLCPTSLLGGALAVVACAFLAAVFLTAEARRLGSQALESAFRKRSLLASAVAGALALEGIAILDADSHRLYVHLLGPGLPLVLLSGVAGLATLVVSGRAAPRVLRVLAVIAVATVLMGWGVAQYPFILGTHLSIAQAAAPGATLDAVLVIFVAAAVLCVPSIAFLYILEQRGRLETT